MSTETVQPPASYPLLAQHMNVQGSVVLQALIGADGVIQNLHVLSGPAILASAAEQAVREWRFKPIVQNGQAVESKAKITVNFTIKVADSSGRPRWLRAAHLKTIRITQPFALIICSACLREVSVSFAPLSMRATSSVRSSPVTARMLVRVRPPDSFFSIT